MKEKEKDLVEPELLAERGPHVGEPVLVTDDEDLGCGVLGLDGPVVWSDHSEHTTPHSVLQCPLSSVTCSYGPLHSSRSTILLYKILCSVYLVPVSCEAGGAGPYE